MKKKKCRFGLHTVYASGDDKSDMQMKVLTLVGD